MLLKLSQISLENTCVGVFFNEVAGLRAFNSMKKKFQRNCFPVKFAKFLRTPERLLLYFHVILFTMHEKDTACMMGFFAKTVNDLLFSQKSSIIDIWYGSKYRSSRSKVFCKKKCSFKFRKIHREKLVLESPKFLWILKNF